MKNKSNSNYSKIIYIVTIIIVFFLCLFLFFKIKNFMYSVKVSKIEIQGVGIKTQEYLYNEIKSLMNNNILNINLEHLTKFMLSKSFVYKANVYRNLNGKIIINIVERNPYFLWENDTGEYQLVNSQNEILDIDLSFPVDNLIVVKKGVIALDNFDEIRFLIYSDINILYKIKYLVFNGYRWDIVLQNGIIIKLPQEDLGIAYKKIIEFNNKYNLINKKIEYIDATSVNKIYILPQKQ